MQNEKLNRRDGIVSYEGGHEQSDKRPWFGSLPDKGEGSYSFAVMGDRCGMATEGVFEGALEVLKDLRPAFVITVGDMIEGYHRDAADAHAEWDEWDGMVRASGLPLFPAVGNHDYGNRLMADVWQSRKGPTYYAYRVGDALFLSLNTEHTPEELSDAFLDIVKRTTARVKQQPALAADHMRTFHAELIEAMTPEQLRNMTSIRVSLGTEQLDWAARVLEEHADVSWTFVTMHKPGWKSDSADYAKLIGLLGDRPYTIFAGHLHALEMTGEASRELIQMGRTGGLAHGDGTHKGDANMLLWVTVRDGRPSYRVLPLDGIHAIEDYAPIPAATHGGA